MAGFIIKHIIKNADNVTDEKVREKYGSLGSTVGILTNVTLSITKFVLGLITGSLAVSADAVNNISDAAGSLMSLISVKLAAKPVDEDHPFGHGRMEYIGTLAVGVLILVAGIQLFKDGIDAILNPTSISVSTLVIVLLVLSIGAKLWLYFFYKKIGLKINNDTLIAAAKDSLNDVLATLTVLLSIVFQYFFPYQIDGYVSLIVAFFVLKTGFEVCKETIDKLIGGMPDPALVSSIRDMLLTYPGIIGVHDLVVHDYGPNRCIVTVHAEVDARDNIVEIHEVIDRAEREMEAKLHIMLCIHMDPIVMDDPVMNKLHTELSAYLVSIDPKLSLHDFRMVPGQNQINLIFDCLVPNGYKGSISKLSQSIKDYAKTLDPRYCCVIRFDSQFCEIE